MLYSACSTRPTAAAAAAALRPRCKFYGTIKRDLLSLSLFFFLFFASVAVRISHSNRRV